MRPLEGREKWRDRPDRFEKPLQFIARVYPDRRKHRLCRADFLRLDQDFYEALAQWLKRDDAAIPKNFGLPTKPAVNNGLLDRLEKILIRERFFDPNCENLCEFLSRTSSAARRREAKRK